MFTRNKIIYSGFSNYSIIKKVVYIAIVLVFIAVIWTGYFLIKFYSSSDINLTGNIFYKSKPLSNVTVAINSESVVSDENGNFVLSHLGFGGNTVKIEKAGYNPIEKKVFLWRENQKIDDITLVRDERYNFSFSGVVLDNFDKKPIKDAIINLGGSTTTTNLSGQFGFIEMPSVATKISISAVGFRDFEEDIVLGDGSSTNNKEYLLTPYGRISFTSQRDGKKDIYTINYDGKNLKNLTSGIKGDCWGGQITPDGSKLVFYSNFENQLDAWGQLITAIYVLERGGDKPVKISQNIIPDGSFKISKDSKKIVFSGSIKDVEGTEIYIAGLGKEKEWIQFTNNDLTEGNIDISPDGNWIVYGSFIEGVRVISIQKIGEYDSKKISSSQNRETFVSYSPNGENILYVRETMDFGSRLYIYNIEKEKEKEIYKTSANIKNIVWGKSADKIIFTSTRDNKDNIYSINISGSNEIKLTSQGANYENILWPDLEKILVFMIKKDNGNSLAVMDISKRSVFEIEQIGDDVLSWDGEVFDTTPADGL